VPSPPGDLTLFCRLLQSASSLLGFAKVLPGKNALALAGAPPRVVMFPVNAVDGVADDRTVTIKSSWMLFTGHFWAADVDQAFDLRERWFQAIRAQADAKGYFWKSPEGENERWDTAPDTAQQGQEFEIDVLLRIDANKVPLSMGTVAATSMNRVCTLAADMGSTDTTVTVDATFELPSTGVLYIDSEAISYSGLTATTFTGLARGIKSTSAATHTHGTPVYVSPT
jgi:hypothetical protein